VYTLRILMLLSMLTATIGYSQQVHSLLPDTKGNRVELTVANQALLLARNVEVRVVRHPSHVTLSPTVQVVDSVAPGQERAVVFSFDIARSAPANKRDTLEFRITEGSGAVWTKSIIVQYAGPTTFALDQNFPNPFNPTTKIQYQLPTDSRVTLKVYDVLGREVTTLLNDIRPAGYHDAQWDAGNVASGVYFYRMEAEALTGGSGFQQIKKLLVVK
jgi:hypothetical protein